MKRLLRKALALPLHLVVLAIVVLVVLAVLAGKGAMEIGKLVTAARGTGNPNVDRFAWKVARAVLLEWGPTGQGPNGEPLEGVARLAAQIIDHESRGARPPVLGDQGFSGGPSVGPMQVYRSTAKEMGLWSPSAAAAGNDQLERQEYAAKASDESWCIRAGVAVMRAKQRVLEAYLATHPGETRTLQDLARLYNGAGNAARQYAMAVAGEAADDYGADWMTRTVPASQAATDREG